MTKIERLEAAYEMLHTELSGYTNGSAWTAIKAADQILNPPPEYEEVEESAGWVNIYPVAKPTCTIKTRVSHAYPDKDTADANAKETRIDCQEIKVKVRREKVRPVERSVTVGGILISDGRTGYDKGVVLLSESGEVGVEFAIHPEFHGCVGSLTFTTTDPPK
jgi:hypothetical protein